MNRTAAQALLRVATGVAEADFRDGQWEAIRYVVEQRGRLLVVERTGWGKSLVYFIATRILRDGGAGPTLIVSPLLALMRNQVDAARRLGLVAETINSSNKADWERVKALIRADRVDVLLISPERLGNEEFVEDVLEAISGRVGLLVIDEAHCISDWGHDFRPDYQRIINILRQMPRNMPVLGTTATANDRVVADVAGQLGDVRIQRGSLERASLGLQAFRAGSQIERLAWLAEHLPELEGTGIVYVLTVRDAIQVADWLAGHGLRSQPYHASVSLPGCADVNESRLVLEEQLLANELDVLVATTALGMGYDKPDLAFVVHYQAPGSIISYYQQVGRAGRAISRAEGILMTGPEDADIHRYFRENAFPGESPIREILTALGEHDGISSRGLEEVVNLRTGQIGQALKFLSVQSPSPVQKIGSQWFRTAVDFALDQEKIERLTRQREREWEEVQAYIDGEGCRMQWLRRALDDASPEPCGRCDNCRGAPLVSRGLDEALVREAAVFLRGSSIPIEPKRQAAAAAFEAYGLASRIPEELRMEPGRALCRWEDAGWGHDVAIGKHGGRFGDDLVDALVAMIRERWLPEPMPTWLTCVPSLGHPRLVPDLAERLAERLGLEFRPVVVKVHENQPQKMQQNRFQQCRNLDGVFAVEGSIPSGPVFLLDDVVDSGWTLAVVAALLRQAGSGLVHPVALATSAGG